MPARMGGSGVGVVVVRGLGVEFVLFEVDQAVGGLGLSSVNVGYLGGYGGRWGNSQAQTAST